MLGIGLYGKGFVDFFYDEMELGTRVAHFLDSENNTPDVHFAGWEGIESYCTCPDDDSKYHVLGCPVLQLRADNDI